MFTGLVTALGRVKAVDASGGKTRFTVEADYPHAAIATGASIMHDGVCLTVVEHGAAGRGAWWAVEAIPETLSRTALGRLQPGALVNLELSLKLGDELGGHLVYGHVDGLGEAIQISEEGESLRIRIGLAEELAKYVAEKGSIAINGISLTVAAVGGERGRRWFEVAIIPHTATVTTIGTLAVGDTVNLEVDMLARYVARMLEFRT
jgi:riboflavin synthase